MNRCHYFAASPELIYTGQFRRYLFPHFSLHAFPQLYSFYFGYNDIADLADFFSRQYGMLILIRLSFSPTFISLHYHCNNTTLHFSISRSSARQLPFDCQTFLFLMMRMPCAPSAISISQYTRYSPFIDARFLCLVYCRACMNFFLAMLDTMTPAKKYDRGDDAKKELILLGGWRKSRHTRVKPLLFSNFMRVDYISPNSATHAPPPRISSYDAGFDGNIKAKVLDEVFDDIFFRPPPPPRELARYFLPLIRRIPFSRYERLTGDIAHKVLRIFRI